MSPEQNKNSVGISRLLLGFAIGFFSWLAGLHCIEMDSNGNAHLSPKKFLGHALKVFLWVLGITLLYEILGMGLGRLRLAPALGGVGVLLVWFVLFIGLKFFRKGAYLWVLPGFHRFSCPSCYQSQSFRFQPVSIQLGFWVTYLCPNCACLVNGWGEQVVYPIKVPFGKLTPCLFKSVPGVLIALALGIGLGAIPFYFLLAK
jgi:hypothetical protein